MKDWALWGFANIDGAPVWKPSHLTATTDPATLHSFAAVGGLAAAVAAAVAYSWAAHWQLTPTGLEARSWA